MIRVSLNEGYYSFRVTIDGHANYEAHGKDILCASVSALTQSFVLFCQEKEEDGCATINDIQLENGYLSIDVEGDVIDGFIMLELGLRAISKQYPDYVSMGGRRQN